jgi:hypothetical protein
LLRTEISHKLAVLMPLQFFGGAYRVTGNRLARRIEHLLSGDSQFKMKKFSFPFHAGFMALCENHHRNMLLNAKKLAGGERSFRL